MLFLVSADGMKAAAVILTYAAALDAQKMRVPASSREGEEMHAQEVPASSGCGSGLEWCTAANQRG